MFLNWSLEARKWREILKKTHSLSFSQSLKAIFSGNATGIFTPNRLGAFVGRILYLPKGLKSEGTVTTWVGSAAQLVATLIFGAIGSFFYWLDDSYKWNFDSDYTLLKMTLVYFSLVLMACASVGYFMSGLFINWFSKVQLFSKYVDKLETINSFSFKQLAYYLFLSLLRYLVFVFQFYFLFKAFNMEIQLMNTLVYVGVLYIIIAFMPTMFGKLGVRESVLIILLAHLPYSDLQIVSVSFTLWLINTIFPALLGAFFITQLKKS